MNRSQRFFRRVIVPLLGLAVAVVPFVQHSASTKAQILTQQVLWVEVNNSYTVGDTVTAVARITTGRAVVDTVNYTIKYDKDKLRYLNADQTHSIFPSVARSLTVDENLGTINQLRGSDNLNGFSGHDAEVITFHFQAKAAGSAALSFTPATKVYRNGIPVAFTLNTTNTTINPVPPPVVGAPTFVGFALGPDHITRGESSTITWKTKDATDITLDPGASKLAAEGTQSVKPDTTTTYTITAKNSTGSTSRSLTLVVTPPAPTPPPLPSPTPTPKPTTTTIAGTITTKPTPKPTAKATTKATSTSNATTTPVPTPAPSPDLSKVSLTQSSVTFSKTTATADGVDTITVTTVLKRDDGTVVSDITPVLEGLRQDSDSASPFTFDDISQSWLSQISSNQSGLISVRVLASSVPLATQDLTFTDANASPTPAPTTASGGSFFRTIVIIFVILLILLLLLYFVWRRLRDHDEPTEDEALPAYPGDTPEETQAEPAAAAHEDKPAEPESPKESDTAEFNPNQTLQRSEPPAEEAKNPDDDTIPL